MAGDSIGVPAILLKGHSVVVPVHRLPDIGPDRRFCDVPLHRPGRRSGSRAPIPTGVASWQGNHYIKKTCYIRGPRGPRGFPGLVGPAGPAGPAVGRLGWSGRFPRGPVGSTGPVGPAGSTGPQGLQARPDPLVRSGRAVRRVPLVRRVRPVRRALPVRFRRRCTSSGRRRSAAGGAVPPADPQLRRRLPAPPPRSPAVVPPSGTVGGSIVFRGDAARACRGQLLARVAGQGYLPTDQLSA